MSINPATKYELIITIVDKDMSSDVIDAAKAGGAEGATVMFGRGSGIHEKANKFFGLSIEPEKEIVLIMVVSQIRDQVMESIRKGVDLDKPGNGVSFVLDITKVMGISHAHKYCEEQKKADKE